MLNDEQQQLLKKLVENASQEQLIWLSGYLAGRTAAIPAGTPVGAQALPAIDAIKVTILFGTKTGKSEEVAKLTASKLSSLGVSTHVVSMEAYKLQNLKTETHVLVAVSTHGEGEPPVAARDFYDFLHGRKAPKLQDLKFAVIGLGDKSYEKFCQTGADIHEVLLKLGATAIAPLTRCDVDFEEEAAQWIDNISAVLSQSVPTQAPAATTAVVTGSTKNYTRSNPFYAEVLVKQRITSTESDKEVTHYEISLADSGIEYQPGDALGVFGDNPPHLVEAILAKTGIAAETPVETRQLKTTAAIALRNHFEITVLSKSLLQAWLQLSNDKNLEALLTDSSKTESYLYGHDVLDLLTDFPFATDATTLFGTLRRMPPRLYSISSSNLPDPGEVHITVASVRYNTNDRHREGACSTFLAGRITEGEKIPVFVEKNPSFRLPQDQSPVIMIGAGTGIAPYRAFLQHRAEESIQGNTWLFFGDRRFRHDFLYQLEWQKFIKNGILQKMNVAFSRDGAQKQYVQHKLAEHATEIWQWISNGAVIYICGDRKNMAADVQKTLKEIIAVQGNKTESEAGEFLKNMEKERKLQLDVY